jgi:cation:H+ antiporter
VRGAVGLAEAAGVSDVVIGITVVAVGPSQPDLVTGVTAARRGETDLVVGNVLGSNLFNALLVAGVAALIDTAPLAPSFAPNMAVMLLASVAVALLLRSGRTLTRAEAAALLAAYPAAVAVAVLAG